MAPLPAGSGKAILVCHYFTVDRVFLKRLYVLFFLELASRRIRIYERAPQTVAGHLRSLVLPERKLSITADG